MHRYGLRIHHAERSAFTLLELLVVVSVMALLAALLLPAVSVVREAALGTKCAVNLRQIASASQAYSQDWRGLLVMSYVNESPWTFWYQSLAPYTEESAVISNPARGRILRGCPRWQRGAVYPTLTVNSWQWQQYSGYCETEFLLPAWQITTGGASPYPFGCTQYQPPLWGSTYCNPVARITKISERPFIFDSPAAALGMLSWWSTANDKANTMRHAGRASVLYFDSHVGRETWLSIATAQGLTR
jgi:prepilin-type N-terminal cleavage/methylation domain-containing protein/prepilin-type processing-associated H-X9-DG protein